MDIARDVIDLRLMFGGVKQVSDSRENTFAETGANVRKTFHVTGHGIPNIGKQPFDAYISRHRFAMEMYNLKFFCPRKRRHVVGAEVTRLELKIRKQKAEI